MLPLKDNVPTRTFPYVTVALIAVNVAVWLWEVVGGVNDGVTRYGYYPCTVEGPCVQPASLVPHLPWYESVFSSMFLHGGWLHIAGNMLFLWIFGNNVEDAFGHVRYLIFFTFIELPAIVFLFIWFAQQAIFGAIGLTNPTGDGGGVAYFAHVGGFIFGLLAIKVFAQRRSAAYGQPKYPVY